MRKRSWELETSRRVVGAEALWETEERAVMRKMGTAPNPGRMGKIGRERDDFSAGEFG